MYGTIEECFYDFVEKHPDLPHLQVVADFCVKGDLARVQRWQRREFFPGGADQLAVGCILQILGYDILELNRLEDSFRKAVFLMSLGQVTPDAMRRYLEYTNHQSMWRFFLHGEGTSEKRRKKIAELVGKKWKKIPPMLERWKGVAAALDAQSTQEVKEPEATPLTFSPEIATAFARSVGATTNLAQILVAANGGKAAQEATRGGSDIHELVELLGKLTK